MAAEMQFVDSSSIEAIGWDATSQELLVRFLDGRLYAYFEVPEHVHLDLMNAPSKGSYFNREIKSRFQYEQR